ncbi:MAG: hypothetical protein Q7N50_02315 [Armatimonadota bacterium]|nr:hypothetical protein [Armatimonadota bacterium]
MKNPLSYSSILRLARLMLPLAILALFARGVLAQSEAIPQPTLFGTHVHGDIMAGYYAQSDVYDYLADINIWFDYGSAKGAKLYFYGGILTLIKSTDEESFEPDRYRGTLEPGIRLQRGNSSYEFFIKHQSFHDIDRFDDLDETYEIYGLRYRKAGPWNYTLSAGKYENKDDVDYDWDYYASLDNACIRVCNGKPIYTALSLHGVTEDGSLANRDDFLDYSLEVGLQSSLGIRYFANYRQTHDIDRFNGATDHGIILGVRYAW